MKRQKSVKPEYDHWEFQVAKAKLSHVLDNAQKKGVQVVVRNKNEIFYLISEKKYTQLAKSSKSLIEIFKDASDLDEGFIPERDKDLPRDFDL